MVDQYRPSVREYVEGEKEQSKGRDHEVEGLGEKGMCVGPDPRGRDAWPPD